VARTTMTWIISELRRKVNDYRPEASMDSDIAQLGDTIRIKCTYYNLASVAITPTTPKVSIKNPNGSTVVNAVSTIASSATGVQYYDYKIPITGPEGVWRVNFTGKLGTVTSAYSTEFEARNTQRIWSDDELQNYLDRNRLDIGIDEPRELLQCNVSYTKYKSKYRNLETSTLYNSDADTAVSVTPTTVNLVDGSFTFATSQNVDLYLEGISYNILISAAECLEELSADLSRTYQWSRGGVSHTANNPLLLARYYRSISQGGQSVRMNKVY
jgi:hypothetical protein